MGVKDYLKAMTEENQIRCEKVGSGNWYWCFMSDEKMKKEKALAQAQADNDKARKTVEELREKVDDAIAEREEDDEDMLMEPGQDRNSMMNSHTELSKALDALRTELAGYSENDPIEVDSRRKQVEQDRLRVEMLTDAIYSMEGWFKQALGGDKEQLMGMKRSFYGDEYDEEACGLREV
jgi:hypothetical protein